MGLNGTMWTELNRTNLKTIQSWKDSIEINETLGKKLKTGQTQRM